MRSFLEKRLSRIMTAPQKKFLHTKDHLEFVKSLRKSQTDAERFLWKYLRNRRFRGLKFRRQFPIGRYILDFFCVEKRLAIELDGGQHSRDTVLKKDKTRGEFLQRFNITVIRFWDNDVLTNLDGVLQRLEKKISKKANDLTPPSPERRGEIKASLYFSFKAGD